MAARLLRRSDHRRMPWKNGGGETIEIAVGPDGAGLDDFDWRVSLARVERDGPFSVFPGIDRTLSIVEGRGIALAFGGGRTVTLTGGDAPFAFPGDVAVEGRLIDGPLVDLNVMTRRGTARSEVSRFTGSLQIDQQSAEASIVYCHAGRCRVVTEDASHWVGAGDALMVVEPRHVSIDADAEAYQVRILLAGA
ncbi:HutD family protein [Kaistia defluvii]|uniref:HutD/Ves family protein n=1 Tax=Kaistia defluvii TaxID=410841 RepID=UPI00225575FC|nr:HutD family protein [Kaistia defluvii]MCX5517871.1 HutD family protein [Kaistia defluvii]